MYTARASLCKGLWPKLLKAASVEAIAELSGGKFGLVNAEMVDALFVNAESGKASEQEVTSRIKLITKESDKSLLFETCDLAREGLWIHRNYLVK